MKPRAHAAVLVNDGRPPHPTREGRAAGGDRVVAQQQVGQRACSLASTPHTHLLSIQLRSVVGQKSCIADFLDRHVEQN